MSEILLNRPPEIPEHLQEGWKAFSEWAEAMARAGEPLPPGGCFILNRNTILSGCLMRLHRSICAELKMESKCVKITVQRNDFGGMEPSVDVYPPDGWMEDVYFKGATPPGGQRADEFAKAYISGVLERYYAAFREDIEGRIKGLEACSRPDLEMDGIEDLIAEPESKEVTGEDGEAPTPG